MHLYNVFLFALAVPTDCLNVAHCAILSVSSGIVDLYVKH